MKDSEFRFRMDLEIADRAGVNRPDVPDPSLEDEIAHLEETIDMMEDAGATNDETEDLHFELQELYNLRG